MEVFVSDSGNVMQYWVETNGIDLVVLAGWETMPSAEETREGLTWIAQETAKLRLGATLEFEYTDTVKETDEAKVRRANATRQFLETGKHGAKTKRFERPSHVVSNTGKRVVERVKRSVQAQTRKEASCQE